jgi:hypothetical protein
MIAKSITMLDFLSVKPELNFSSQSRVKSLLGGILSIILYLVTLIGLIIFSEDFREKKGAIVRESSLYVENTRSYITRDNFFVKFGLFNTDSTSLGNDWDTYYNVFAHQFSYRYQYNNLTDKNEVKLFTREINTTKCNYDYINKFFPQFNKSSYEYFYCLDPDFNFELLNKFANVGENSFLNIYFTICKNETAAKYGKTCKPLEEIKQKLLGYVIKFSISDYFIDHENLEEPFTSYMNDQGMGGDLSKYSRKHIFLKDYNYTTDIGALLEEKDIKQKLVFSSSEITTDERPESKKFIRGTFNQYTVTYGKLGFHTSAFRRYQKIQNVLANVSGFISALQQFLLIMMRVISQFNLYNTIIIQSSLPFTFRSEDKTNQSEMKLIHMDDVKNLVGKVSDAHRNMKFFIPTMCMQFRASLKCLKKRDNKITLLNHLNKKILDTLDVNNFIKMSNTVNGLKDYLFNEEQLRLFDYINKLQGNSILSPKTEDKQKLDINLICKEIENHPNETTRKLLNLLMKKAI